MLGIRNDNKEFVLDAFNFCICQTVLHRKRCQLLAWEAKARCTAACQRVHNAVFVHISNITGVQPDAAVIVLLQCASRCSCCIVTDHVARSGHTDLAHFIVSQFFMRARSENRHHRKRHRNANIAVAKRIGGHRQCQIGACLTASVTTGELCLAIVVIQELLCTLHLVVVKCLAACAGREQMRHVVVIRHTAVAHDSFDKHRNQRPAIRTIPHHFQVNIFRCTERIQNQQLVGSQRQQHHRYNNSNQARRQLRQQPRRAEFVRCTIEIHLMQIANHGVCGMNNLLGRAGRTTGIRAEQRTIYVSRRFHLTGILLAHLKNPIPRHGSAAVCRLIRIVAVNVLLNMRRHRCVMCAAVRRYQNRNLRIRAVTVCIQLSL